MLPIALLALLSAATLTALLHDGPDGTGTEDAAGPDTETPETDPATLIEVTPGTTVNGGADSEGFEITRQMGGVGDPVTINAGAGDDTVTATAFTGDFDEPEGFVQPTVNSGAGDDLIEIALSTGAQIDAGEGNDTITLTGGDDADVSGGTGNDSITVTTEGFSPSDISGGDGDDTITAIGGGHGVEGGAGNDVITLGGLQGGGDGLASRASAGDGNDTITAEVTTPGSANDYFFDRTIRVTGGAGADTFVTRVSDVEINQTSIQPLADQLDQTIDEFLSTPNPVMRITDFEPGVDRIQVEADPTTDNGVLAEAELQETTSAGGVTSTQLILTYENPDQPDVRVVVTLGGATGVTWDDIEFVGDQTPVLVPAPAA